MKAAGPGDASAAARLRCEGSRSARRTVWGEPDELVSLGRTRLSAAMPLADGYGPEWASAWGVDEYGVYAEFTFHGEVQRMRWIEPGTFLMGSPERESGHDELQHEVTLSRGYWVADTACTQALWEAAMGINHSYFKGKERPMEQVSWEACQEFLKRINGQRSGLHLRLLTEAEWEHACRAGTSGPFSFGANIMPEQVNYDGGARGTCRLETLVVKALPPNRWGLYAMHGNVWEWCQDWYGAYDGKPEVDPVGPTKGSRRVLRGGSWSNLATSVRSASRLAYVPDSRDFYVGFRFARGHE